MPVLREDGFGVELNAFDGQLSMAHAHDLAVIRPGGHFEIRWTRLALDCERMVPSGFVRRRQAAENAGARVMDARHLAVHERLRVHHMPAECLPDRLVPETYAEDRHVACEFLDHGERDTG